MDALRVMTMKLSQQTHLYQSPGNCYATHHSCFIKPDYLSLRVSPMSNIDYIVAMSHLEVLDNSCMRSAGPDLNMYAIVRGRG